MKSVIHADGAIKHYTPDTIEKLYRNYKEKGFDAPIPTGWGDHCKPFELDDDLLEQIKYLKTPDDKMHKVYIIALINDTRIGSVVHYDRPYTPTEKAYVKIVITKEKKYHLMCKTTP